MKKFNLLVVSDTAASSEQYLKMLGKVSRRNLVMQVESLEEADLLLGTLQMDMVIIDLDRFRVNLDQYASKQPNLTVVGTGRSLSNQVLPLNGDRVKLIPKSELLAGVNAEFKALRKGRFPAPAWMGGSFRTDRSLDFKNFNQLVVSGH